MCPWKVIILGTKNITPQSLISHFTGVWINFSIIFHVDALHMHLFSVMQMCNFGCWEVRAGNNSRGKKNNQSDQKCTIWLSHCLSFSESCLCLALQLILWSHVKKWLNQRWNHSFTTANKILDGETRTAQFWFQGSVITVMVSCNGVWETRGNCKRFSHCASAFCNAFFLFKFYVHFFS